MWRKGDVVHVCNFECSTNGLVTTYRCTVVKEKQSKSDLILHRKKTLYRSSVKNNDSSPDYHG